MNRPAFLMILLWGLINQGCQKITGGALQVSTPGALESGKLDGQKSLQEIQPYGDFGLGVFHALGGEMIMINGDIYRTHADQAVTIPDLNLRTPYSIITRFEPTIRQDLHRAMTLEQLQFYLNKLVPDQNTFCFYYIRGQFDYMVTRNLRPQRKPYPSLSSARKTGRVFRSNQIYGSLVGIRVPPSWSGIHPPGFTFHFLNEARNFGGYVEDAKIESGQIRIDDQHEWYLLDLPPY